MVNGKTYYGSHRTNKMDDEYMGSGTVLKQAIKKYGKGNFNKDILEFYHTEEELFEAERQLVTSDMVLDKQNYNIAIGGAGMTSEIQRKFWSTPEGEALKRQLSTDNTGYEKNKGFLFRWKTRYNEVIHQFSDLVLNTNLPDKFILRQVKTKDYGFKFHRLLRYARHIGLVGEEIERVRIHEYFSTNRKKNTFVKTISHYPEDKQLKLKRHYKSINKGYLDDFNVIMNLLEDKRISDSMLYNNTSTGQIRGVKARTVLKQAEYFEYLGLIKKAEQIKIDIRSIFPNAHRKTGTKTLYKRQGKFIQNYLLIGEKTDEQYSITFNGETVQYARI